MKVTGVTIVKNAIDFDYPIAECIKSLLPLVDELIVSIGDGHDNTAEVVVAINSSKIKIVYSVWDKNNTTGGTVLAQETDKVIAQVSRDTDWIFYLQADEVLHQDDYTTIKNALRTYKDDKKVEGLLFYYKHFFGSFDYIGDSRRWYNYEIRVVKNNLNVSSYLDAQGFRRNGKKLHVKKIAAYIYHYGWVRTPNAQVKKINNFGTYWGGTAKENVATTEMYDYIANVDSIEHYRGTHPLVMKARIANKNWELHVDVRKKNFSKKDWVLYKIEKWTGIRLFAYKNYKII